MTPARQQDRRFDPALVQDLVEALDLKGGSTTRRPVHTVGIGVTGSFLPSDVAKEYCRAAHFQGPHELRASARFSNGVGLVDAHDGWNDVRGFAVKFHLAEGVETDLITMTLPEFFAPTPEEFLKLARDTKPVPLQRETAWRKLADMLHLLQPLKDPHPTQRESAEPSAVAYADLHAFARLPMFHASSLGAPVSYAREAYHAVHTFVVEAPDGTRRHVRFSWIPVAGIRKVPATETAPDDYLQAEIRRRIAAEPVRFQLMMVIGEDGDDFADSCRSWPPHRSRVVMGMLTLDAVPEDQHEYGERISFNPCRLVRGIEPSEDEILLVRRQVYEWSRERRGGTCPFAAGAWR